MKPEAECGTCLTHWIYGRASAAIQEGDRLRLLEAVVEAMAACLGRARCLGELSNAGTDAAFRRVPGARGGYAEAKAASNRAAGRLLPAAAAYVEGGESPRERLLRACSVAALANVAPLGVPTGPMAFEELGGFLDAGNPGPVVQGDPGILEHARRVVYVADNAGEIGFDSLLVRIFKERGVRVTLVVKEPDFFEDATPADAGFFGLDDLADRVVAVDGFLVPQKASPAAAEALAASDLAIAKGTGSFEALYGELGDTPGVFMLKVKCGPVSRALGLPKGAFAVTCR